MLTNFKKWPMESTSTTKGRVPQSDGLTQETINRYGLTEDQSTGMLLESTPATAPLSSLSEAEREARIAANVARIAADREARVKEQQERVAAEMTKPATVNTPTAAKLPLDLKLLNCARCSRTLLGESQEPLRERLRRALPPPVGARLFGGRPYCAGCAAYFDGV